MIPISQMYAGENQKFEKIINIVKFGIHVCLPCIVQSYNQDQMTVDVQPTIRERVIDESGGISYVNYPLLINVPIVFPSCGNFHITFPVNLGDECLVVFSDLAIDNWWVNGNVQNPIEQRRHDLSDGFAIFGISNLNKIKNENIEPSSSNMKMYNSVNGVGFEIGEENGKVSCMVHRTFQGPPPYTTYKLETYDLETIITKLFPNAPV